jgi:mRNA interferase MazF
LVILQGDVWWVDLPAPAGAEPGFRRPMIVMQADAFSASRLSTVVAVPLTAQGGWAERPGAAALPAEATGLSKDSVALAFGITPVDRRWFVARVGRLSPLALSRVLDALDTVLGR